MDRLSSEKELEEWLKGKPNNIGHLILGRTLLRIFPLVNWPSEGVDLFDDEYANRQIMIDLFRIMNCAYTLPQLKNEKNFSIIASHLIERNILRASGTFYNSLITSVFRESFQSFRSTKHASTRAFPSIQKAFRLLDSVGPNIKGGAGDLSTAIDSDI